MLPEHESPLSLCVYVVSSQLEEVGRITFIDNGNGCVVIYGEGQEFIFEGTNTEIENFLKFGFINPESTYKKLGFTPEGIRFVLLNNSGVAHCIFEDSKQLTAEKHKPQLRKVNLKPDPSGLTVKKIQTLTHPYNPIFRAPDEQNCYFIIAGVSEDQVFKYINEQLPITLPSLN